MNRACFPILSSLLGTLLLASCGTVTAADPDGGLRDAGIGTTDGGANPVLCGNNMPDVGETCDDGNKDSGDGCSEACLDETDFCNPRPVGNIYSMSSDGGRMVAEGDYLYLAAAPFILDPIFKVLDVSNPNNVVEASTFRHDERPNAQVGGIVKRGNSIWLAGNDPGLTSIDVTDPTNAQLGGLDLNPSSRHIARIGDDFLFATHSVSERPQIHDITTQAPISLVTLGDSNEVYYNVGASDTLAFASTSSNDVDIFSGTDNPVTASIAGRYEHAPPWNNSNAVTKILASGDILILAVTGTSGSGIHLVDVGIPSVPVLISTISETPNDIAVVGNYIYVPRSDGLRVYDISDPANPVPAGSIIVFEFFGSSVAVDGSRAYVIGENDLMIVEGLPGICQPICGNNNQEYSEACDDGNTVDGDGCSADCAASS